jgi:general secretion pathway protein D
MKPCRFPTLRLTAGVFAALALAGLAVPLAAQEPVPAPPAESAAPALPQTPGAPTALVAIPPAGDGAGMIDNIKLSDNPLATVLDMLEQLTGRSVIRPQQLPTPTFTFNSHGPISKRDAIVAIESLLSLNNIAAAPMGEKFIKVVVITNIRTEAPELVMGSLRDQPPSGKIVSKLFRLSHLDTTSFQNQVQPFLSPGFGSVVPFQNSNTLLVTDTISNLQRLEYVLAEVDKPRDLVTKFYTLKYAQAQAVSEKIKSLIETTRTAFNRQNGGNQPGGMPMPPGMPTPQTGDGSGDNAAAGLGAALISATTSLNFDERTNQVILVTDSSSVHFYDNLIDKLDVQADPSTKIDVVQIQHAQATEIASLLSTFVSGSTGSASRSSSSGSGRSSTTRKQRSSETFPGLGRTTPTNPTTPSTPSLPGGGTGERNSRFSEFMTILADERSNAIVVSGTQDDLKLVRELVKQIDVVLPQVQIDVLIASVNLDNTVKRGIDAFTGITVEGNKVTGIMGSADGKTPGITGPGFDISKILFAGKQGFTANVTMPNTNSNVRILSTPSITTTSNQEATITVATAIPIITSAYSDVTAGTVGARNSYSYQNVGLELTVKPLIGLDGTIQMEIEQSADDFVNGVPKAADTQPAISKRTAKSFVSVQDGEIIVLAGMQKDSKNKARSTMPLLGEIPFLGVLFGSNSRSVSREEVIFFIQPRILRTTADANRLARQEAKDSLVAPLMEKRLKQTFVLPAEPLAK